VDGTEAPQVIVGVSGSLASLHALRHAVAEARRRTAMLTMVHAYRIGAYSDPAVLTALREPLQQAAFHRLRGCLDDALGGPPAELALRLVVVGGRPPGQALVAQVHAEDDLLVVGGASGRRFGLHPCGRTADYCARHAPCPVLVVPPPRLARELCGHGRLRRQVGRELARDLRAVQ
jgi:nucleotide-binding universal stress UspA family protein